jgi:predicted MPP superfamily phosphohydrolase
VRPGDDRGFDARRLARDISSASTLLDELREEAELRVDLRVGGQLRHLARGAQRLLRELLHLRELFGTDDAPQSRDRLGALPRVIDAAREQASWQEQGAADVSVGVTHAPYQRVLNAFVNQGADLILAGHTHGGQVRVPGFPALVANCDIPRDQAQGVSTWGTSRGSSYLEVSAGLGTSIYAPVRFACPPEAVVLTLVARVE